MIRRIQDIEGIDEAYAHRLALVGIKSDADLLARAGSAQGRIELALQTGISVLLILKWVNHANLMRIVGVGPQFAELLEASGVDTIKELARRKAAILVDAMARANGERRLSGGVPAVSQVAGWIGQAKKLARKAAH